MERQTLALLLTAWVSAPAIGCGSDELRVATFNVGLAPGEVPLTDERVAPIGEALGAADVDIFCLQEVWRSADLPAIVPADATVVRHPDAGEVAGCEEGELAPVADCVEAECGGVCGTGLLECALDRCGALDALSTGCVSCAIENAGCVGDIRAACDTDGGTDYLFPSYDTAIVTRLPVLEQHTEPLDSTLVRSAVLHAKVDTALGPVDVFCAHFASRIATYEYSGDHGSWAGERAAQVRQTAEFIRSRRGEGPVLVLGDLNAESGAPELAPLVELGLIDGAASMEPQCTSCPDNSFRSMESPARRVDHLWVGPEVEVEAERWFDQLVTIAGPEGAFDSHLSDHYGILGTVRR